jgi:3-hydroxybutyryl-CoA dehydrogenase
VLLADLNRDTQPTQFLKDKVASGKVGMRAGEGLRQWTPEAAEAVRERLRRSLADQAKTRKK